MTESPSLERFKTSRVSETLSGVVLSWLMGDWTRWVPRAPSTPNLSGLLKSPWWPDLVLSVQICYPVPRGYLWVPRWYPHSCILCCQTLRPQSHNVSMCAKESSRPLAPLLCLHNLRKILQVSWLCEGSTMHYVIFVGDKGQGWWRSWK